MSHEKDELWPDNWKETREKAGRDFADLKAKVSEGPLSLDELARANSLIDHLQAVWERSWRNPVIREGVDILRTHFIKKFSLDQNGSPRRVFNRIFEATSAKGYFEGRDSTDPELEAISNLLVHQWDTSRTSYRDRYEVDFSGLVNPNWYP